MLQGQESFHLIYRVTKSKVATSNGSASETIHFWPYVVKTKSGLKSGGFFWHCKQTAENCKQAAENLTKSATPETHFGFTNMASEMHTIRVTAIWSCNFWFGSACRNKLFRFSRFWNWFFSLFRLCYRRLSTWSRKFLQLQIHDWDISNDA